MSFGLFPVVIVSFIFDHLIAGKVKRSELVCPLIKELKPVTCDISEWAMH